MKIQKKELVRILGKMKGVVQKNDAFPATAGVLVNDGYFIGTNQEITVKIKSADTAGEKFVIPMEAFELINNLPDEDVDISADNKVITIKTTAIRNRFNTHNPDRFAFKSMGEMQNTIEVDGLRMTDAISHVLFASTDEGNLKGIHLADIDGKITVEASDGHVLARDVLEVSGQGVDVIIPKAAAKKVLGVGLYGKVKVSLGKLGIQFETEDATIGAQLYAGKYPDLNKIMNMEPSLDAEIRKKDIQEAIMRAKACVTSQEKVPVRLKMNSEELEVSIAGSNAQFSENLPIKCNANEDLTIGFDSKLAVDVLKAFDDEEIHWGFMGKNMPSILGSEHTNMVAVLLPINIG